MIKFVFVELARLDQPASSSYCHVLNSNVRRIKGKCYFCNFCKFGNTCWSAAMSYGTGHMLKKGSGLTNIILCAVMSQVMKESEEEGVSKVGK